MVGTIFFWFSRSQETICNALDLLIGEFPYKLKRSRLLILNDGDVFMHCVSLRPIWGQKVINRLRFKQVLRASM